MSWIEALDWALKSIEKHRDNSLFGTPFELEVFGRHWDSLRAQLAEIDLLDYSWKPGRRMLFPKDRVSFRRASQLDPLDSLLLTALVRQMGPAIERRRQPPASVPSFRFAAQGDGLYLKPEAAWKAFWERSREAAGECSFVVRTDIADYYNQLSHESIVSQLEESGVDATHRVAIEAFLRAFAGGSRRGLPIGPHAVHLLAEVSLASLDNLLLTKEYPVRRYIDDFHIFCAGESEAQLALFDLAELLDREHGLSLNREKTHIESSSEFIELAELKLKNEPVNEREAALIAVVGDVTGGQYDTGEFSAAVKLDSKAVSEEAITEIFEAYFAQDFINYVNLGRCLRRLARITAPGGVNYLLDHLPAFVPVIGDVTLYLSAAAENWEGAPLEMGEKLVELLELPIVARSEYVQMVLLGLFSMRADLNHFDAVARTYRGAGGAARREILLAAGAAKASDWIYAQRHMVKDFDPWLQRAFVQASHALSEGRQERSLEPILEPGNKPDELILSTILEDRAASVEPAAEAKSIGPPVLVSLHGIRTTGYWQKDLISAVEEVGFKYRPWDYGIFSALKLVIPAYREGRVVWFQDKYDSLRREFPHSSINLVAHSFGTFISAMAMRKYGHIKFDRIVYCGSIVPPEFDWEDPVTRGQVGALLNQCGRRDLWARVVEWIVKDAGPSGVEGFSKTAGGTIRNEFHSEFRHSDFFYQQNYENRWIPFLQGHSLNDLTEPKPLPTNWKFRVVKIAGALVAAAVIVVGLLKGCS